MKITKDEILKENKKLQNKVKRLKKDLELCKQMLETATEEASHLKSVVNKYREEWIRRETQKVISRKTCSHCDQRKATRTDHNNNPLCGHCFKLIAARIANGW